MSTGEGWNTGAQIGLQGYLYGNKHHNAQNNKIPGTAGVCPGEIEGGSDRHFPAVGSRRKEARKKVLAFEGRFC